MQALLPFSAEQRYLTYFLEVHSYRVVDCQTLLSEHFFHILSGFILLYLAFYFACVSVLDITVDLILCELIVAVECLLDMLKIKILILESGNDTAFRITGLRVIFADYIIHIDNLVFISDLHLILPFFMTYAFSCIYCLSLKFPNVLPFFI